MVKAHNSIYSKFLRFSTSMTLLEFATLIGDGTRWSFKDAQAFHFQHIAAIAKAMAEQAQRGEKMTADITDVHGQLTALRSTADGINCEAHTLQTVWQGLNTQVEQFRL